MSVTSSTDPVQAVVDILQHAGGGTEDYATVAVDDGETTAVEGTDTTEDVLVEGGLLLSGDLLVTDNPWPGDTPDRIERQSASEPNEKRRDQRRTHVSLYVGVIGGDGQLSKHSMDGDYTHDMTPVVDVYTGSEATAYSYAFAAADILADYSADNGDRTAFVDLFPEGTVQDYRATDFTVGQFSIVRVPASSLYYNDP